MSDDFNYEQTGEQLDETVADLESQINTLAENGGSGIINVEQLAEVLLPHLDVDQLAEAVAPLIDAGDGLTEADVRTLIEENQPDLEIDYEAVAKEVAPLIDSGGGSFPEEEVAELRRVRRRAELAAGGNHVRVVDTGSHEDDGFHPYGAWGVIVEVDEPVQWRAADVHAETGGSVLLEIYEMDYSKDERYDLGEQVATNELRVRSGLETVPIEITLDPGTYYITRDTADPTGDLVSLKRVARDVDWGALNEGHECPVTFHETWQIGREPGTDGFDYYKEQGWNRTFHYWANPEFGFLTLGE